MSKEKAARVRVVTSSGGVVAQRCSFATPQAAYANPLRSANFYIILNNYAICASAHGSSRPAGRIIQIMQKSAGSVPRPTSLSGVLCGRYAVGLCRKRQDRLSFAQAEKNASGCPPARRARLGCDCSSLSPLTLKPLRSPTPCPFTAIATALLSGYAAHAAARSMVTTTVAAGLGFSVASLPQCRRGAFSASIRAVRRLR